MSAPLILLHLSCIQAVFGVNCRNLHFIDLAVPSKSYIAIDLKSFYASVECIERGLDPIDTNLVVADESRTDKTICRAVTPALKAYGIPGRPRLFEVRQKVDAVNRERRYKARGLNIVANHVVPEDKAPPGITNQHNNSTSFPDHQAEVERKQQEEKELAKKRKMQQAMLNIRGKFGKNAILRGMNLEEGATTRDRNSQIGGHKA